MNDDDREFYYDISLFLYSCRYNISISNIDSKNTNNNKRST